MTLLLRFFLVQISILIILMDFILFYYYFFVNNINIKFLIGIREKKFCFFTNIVNQFRNLFNAFSKKKSTLDSKLMIEKNIKKCLPNFILLSMNERTDGRKLLNGLRISTAYIYILESKMNISMFQINGSQFQENREQIKVVIFDIERNIYTNYLIQNIKLQY